MSTVQRIVDRVRVRLNETTARKWTDATQIVPYVADAEQWFEDLLGRIHGSGRYRTRQTFSVAPNVETYPLSSFPTGYRFAEMIELSVLVGSWRVPMKTLPDGDDDARLRNLGLGGGIIIPAYRLFGEELQLLPATPATRNYAANYRYQTAIKTLATDNLDTPAEYDGDIVNRVLHFALADSGIENRKFEEEFAARLSEIEAKECGRQYGANTETTRRKTTRSLFLCR